MNVVPSIILCNTPNEIKAKKYLFHNSKNVPNAPNSVRKCYLTKIRTNWHYYCGKDFMAGMIDLG